MTNEELGNVALVVAVAEKEKEKVIELEQQETNKENPQCRLITLLLKHIEEAQKFIKDDTLGNTLFDKIYHYILDAIREQAKNEYTLDRKSYQNILEKMGMGKMPRIGEETLFNRIYSYTQIVKRSEYPTLRTCVISPD